MLSQKVGHTSSSDNRVADTVWICATRPSDRVFLGIATCSSFKVIRFVIYRPLYISGVAASCRPVESVVMAVEEAILDDMIGTVFGGWWHDFRGLVQILLEHLLL